MSGNSSGPLESSGGGAGGSGEEEKDMKTEETGEGAGGGGSRWPRPETLALLRIRSEMDKSFRESTLKAPLWEEISRKMMELGYKRSSKKCKEKFENVYKYHKRTKEGRTGKSEGKTYRFFEELEAFDSLNSYPLEHEFQHVKSPTSVTTAITTAATSLIPWISSNNPSTEKSSLPLTHHHQVSVKPITTNPTFAAKQSPTTPFPFYSNNNTTTVSTSCLPPISNDVMNNVSSLNLFSSSTSSSTASDEEEDHHQGKRSRKRRKHWKGLFTKLTKELMEKQEKMQKRFLETLENRERERISKEEAWRVQKIAIINREHQTLLHERSNAAAKDAAIISFLQKISGGEQQQPQQNDHKSSQRKQYQSDHSVTFEGKELRPVRLDTTMKVGNYDTNHSISPSSSRWPKTEVEALIRIRKNLEANYQENGTKGPLWEEISSGMRRLGYNRSAKRCKEKWENINKYFKKVKESNKKRPLDSKTCPYFHQLETLYNERNKIGELPLSLPLMATPQRQLLHSQENQIEFETDQRDKVGDKEDEEERDSEEDGYDEEEEDEEGEGDNETSEFEIVLNKTSSSMVINNNLFT